MILWTLGYGAWPAAGRAKGMLGALAARGVTRVVDARLNPCASDPGAGSRYGAKPWTLQAGAGGIAGLLSGAGIAYEWLAELGNPQRRDRRMAVLRGHLADPAGGWPVHRGLALLAARVRAEPAGVALLCACADADACHRTVLARALADGHFGGKLEIRECKEGSPQRRKGHEGKKI